jgi:hypothetical protein
VDYDTGLADFTGGVLPQLERAGLREPVSALQPAVTG